MDGREHLFNVSTVMLQSAMVDHARGYESGGVPFSVADNEFARTCYDQVSLYPPAQLQTCPYNAGPFRGT